MIFLTKKMTAYIYILKCPLTDEIKYVGLTISPGLRLRSHLASAKTGRQPNEKLSNWINELLSKEIKPVFEIVHTCNWSAVLVMELYFIEKYSTENTLFNIQKLPDTRNAIDKSELKKLIKSKGFKRYEIAKQIHVSACAISAFLNCNPSALSEKKVQELINYLS